MSNFIKVFLFLVVYFLLLDVCCDFFAYASECVLHDELNLFSRSMSRAIGGSLPMFFLIAIGLALIARNKTRKRADILDDF